MSLNSSVPLSHSKPSSQFPAASPDYAGLVRFLVQPFLESPDSLSVDCEISPATGRVWIRVAFEGEDKGRVFGRGGRNIQAIRTVIAAAAALTGHSVYIDIYGSEASTAGSKLEESGSQVAAPKLKEPGVTDSKQVTKPRSRPRFQ